MAGNDGSEPQDGPQSEWAWQGDWGPTDSAADDAVPQRGAWSRPGVRVPTAQPSRPTKQPASKPRLWGTVLMALGGAVLGLVWGTFWWEADHTSEASRTQFAWPFLYLAAITSGYVFLVSRWFFRR